jgi:hypothetical protein
MIVSSIVYPSTRYFSLSLSQIFIIIYRNNYNTFCFTFQTALDIRKTIFGKTNLHIALAHEDLAYALYVYEYSSGKFDEAR